MRISGASKSTPLPPGPYAMHAPPRAILRPPPSLTLFVHSALNSLLRAPCLGRCWCILGHIPFMHSTSHLAGEGRHMTCLAHDL